MTDCLQYHYREIDLVVATLRFSQVQFSVLLIKQLLGCLETLDGSAMAVAGGGIECPASAKGKMRGTHRE